MSSSSTPRTRKRPKSTPKTPNYNPSSTPSHSSSSTLTSILVEPSSDFFPSKSELLRLAAVVAIAAAVAAACNFIAVLYTHQPKPFCGSHVEFDDSMSDICEPCPRNGRCYEGQLECIQGYKRRGKLCVEDNDINRLAKILAEEATKWLCEAYAKSMCDGTGKFWVPQDELSNILHKYELVENSGLNNINYMYAKERAMENIGSMMDTRTNEQGIKEFKCPDSVGRSYRPMTCSVKQWISDHFLLIMPVCALFAGSMFLLFRVRSRWYLSKRAEQLYHQVCDVLEENAVMSKSMNDREPWVVASRLRDHLLSPRERRDPLLWKKVEELVELDSRLDRYPKLVKGESKVVWEWQVEGSLSSSSKRKKAATGDPVSSADMDRSNSQKSSLNIEPKSGVLRKCPLSRSGKKASQEI